MQPVNILKNVLGSFIPTVKKGFIELRVSYRQLTMRVLITDFLSVAFRTGFVSVPAVIAGAIFILLPQGRDTLLLVVEKLVELNPIPLIFLVIGLAAWSFCAELSVRYAISISDNSGKSLSDERVDYRKRVQKLLAAVFLLWPCAIVFIGFIWADCDASFMSTSTRVVGFGICLLVVYWLMAVLSNLYFEKSGTYGPGRSFTTYLGARSLPQHEQYWLRKLYGMYNDFVYELPKASSFKGIYREDMATFTDHFVKANESDRDKFPQNPEVLTKLRKVPEDFILMNAGKIITGEDELYKWTYCIPNSFYKGFHRQIKWMSGCALLVFLILCFLPVKTRVFGFLAAPGLLCLAFACYSAMYSGLLYLDHAKLRTWKISVRLLLIIAFIGSSIYNQDHPVRMKETAYPVRQTLSGRFNDWYATYTHKIDSVMGSKDSTRKYPVVFICAEGGALRTGAFTGLFLSELQDSLQNQYHIDFKRSVFAMSGVSGGALGLGFYNAITFKRDVKDQHDRSVDEAKRFFLYDSLSPLIGKMFYGDLLALFQPWHFDVLDRAVALEESWEMAYKKAVGRRQKHNYFAEDFLSRERTGPQPVLAINTTEIETGLQCFITDARQNQLLFGAQRDLLTGKVHEIRYSTAVNFSTRFPLFSPGGKVGDACKTPKYHYLDGGYVENTGSGTMLEMLQALERGSPQFRHVVPIVINLRFSDNTDTTMNIHTFNEITEIFNGIYNTRGGRSRSSLQLLHDFVVQHHGLPIDEPLNSSEKNVPMNWVLSQQSLRYIMEDIQRKLKGDNHEGIITQLIKSKLPFVPYVPVKDVPYLE